MVAQQTTSASWPRIGGEMGARIAAFDWSTNPLGPIEDWPQSLRSVVECLLHSPLPTKLLWGPELVQLYNAPFAALIGGKHPAGLGQRARECWAEIMHLSGPFYARVLAGEVLTLHNKNWKIARRGVENVSFLAHLTPVCDENGTIVGVQAVCVETPGETKSSARPAETEYLAGGIPDAVERNLLEPSKVMLSNLAPRSEPEEMETDLESDCIRRLSQLTRREHEVLQHLVRGSSNKAIAGELGLSVRTVQVHRAHIMNRLGARNLADVVRIALVAELGRNQPGETAGRRLS